jgi:2-amino-4-hydroxy-6-hydroxymethyldihydropteridine diphosphokinase
MPRVFVSIGSNQERERHVRAAVRELAGRFRNLQLSSVYETEAVGFVGDPFLNLVAGFDTDLDLDGLVLSLREIEARAGRVRTDKRFGPRTLDLDVLTYGDHISDGEPVEVPRSEITSEAYVLLPLAEIAPRLQHPELGESYAGLAERLGLDTRGMHRFDLDLQADAGGAPR